MKYNVQVIINGEWVFVQDLPIEKIEQLQKILDKMGGAENE